MQTFRKQLPLFLFFLPLIIFSCKKKEVVKAKAIPEAVKSYVYAYTSGVVSKNDPVRLRFSGAAVGEDLIGEEADDDILDFKPSISGTAIWEDDHTLLFRPKNHWESGQAYIGKVEILCC